MDPWLIALIIAVIGVVFHGIFTGIALVATWYFGHLAEIKLLKEAKEIHAEVTKQIAKMNEEDADYDKMETFLNEQRKVMSGYLSETTRVFSKELGAMWDQKVSTIQTGAPGKPGSTADRLLAMGEQIAAGYLQSQMEG